MILTDKDIGLLKIRRNWWNIGYLSYAESWALSSRGLQPYFSWSGGKLSHPIASGDNRGICKIPAYNKYRAALYTAWAVVKYYSDGKPDIKTRYADKLKKAKK